MTRESCSGSGDRAAASGRRHESDEQDPRATSRAARPREGRPVAPSASILTCGTVRLFPSHGDALRRVCRPTRRLSGTPVRGWGGSGHAGGDRGRPAHVARPVVGEDREGVGRARAQPAHGRGRSRAGVRAVAERRRGGHGGAGVAPYGDAGEVGRRGVHPGELAGRAGPGDLRPGRGAGRGDVGAGAVAQPAPQRGFVTLAVLLEGAVEAAEAAVRRRELDLRDRERAGEGVAAAAVAADTQARSRSVERVAGGVLVGATVITSPCAGLSVALHQSPFAALTDTETPLVRDPLKPMASRPAV